MRKLYIFLIAILLLIKADGSEITEAIWVDPQNPPEEASYYTNQALDALS